MVSQRPSLVVRLAASTIALKAYSSYTPGPIDSILGRKHRGDLVLAVVLVLVLLFVLFFSVCGLMLALWSPSSTAAHFAFCFTSCVVMLAFWSPPTAAHFAFCFSSCD